MSRPRPIVMICCAVFETEVEALRKLHWPDATMRYIPSMMHMRPQALGETLDTVVDEELTHGHHVVLIYGDCTMAMMELEERPGVVRTRGHNCCEMLLGHDEYRRLSHEGAFFLLPEWTPRWHEIFSSHLGLTRENAMGLMRDMQRKILYLDTGIVPVPHQQLQACAQFCGLPYDVKAVSLEHLRGIIDDAIRRLPGAGNT